MVPVKVETSEMNMVNPRQPANAEASGTISRTSRVAHSNHWQAGEWWKTDTKSKGKRH